MGFLNPQVKSKWQVIIVVGDGNKLLIWLRLWLWLCLLGGRNRNVAVKLKWQVIIVVGNGDRLLLWLWLCFLGGRER